MPPPLSELGDFLAHYERDAHLRWSADDLQAQRDFVQKHIRGGTWLDLSTPEAALELVQRWLHPAAGSSLIAVPHDVVLLAGPPVELIELDSLAGYAIESLAPAGRIVGVIPCLRDNSPQNQAFMDASAEILWPYRTAEEILETLRDAHLEVDTAAASFVRIARFNDAVWSNQLAFEGYRRVFERLAQRGYDPISVAWGEVRFVAEA